MLLYFKSYREEMNVSVQKKTDEEEFERLEERYIELIEDLGKLGFPYTSF